MKKSTIQVIKRIALYYAIHLILISIIVVVLYVKTHSLFASLTVGLFFALSYFKFICAKYQEIKNELSNKLSEDKKSNKY